VCPLPSSRYRFGCCFQDSAAERQTSVMGAERTLPETRIGQRRRGCRDSGALRMRQDVLMREIGGISTLWLGLPFAHDLTRKRQLLLPYWLTFFESRSAALRSRRFPPRFR
jgi:hypothetical protein